jgi:hypothetical protein
MISIHFGYAIMNEEQAILDFFSQPENLSLSLSVAEQADRMREQMNNRFWQQLHSNLGVLIKEQGLAWRAETTKDKGADDSLIGLNCIPLTDQQIYLHPMMEQQHLGGEWRIYFGLMWSAPPTTGQLRSDAVRSLKNSLQTAGFKSNESFLAWQWTKFHPRGKNFLLRYANQPEKILDETSATLKILLTDHLEAIKHANDFLAESQQRNLSSSLDQLRDELLD